MTTDITKALEPPFYQTGYSKGLRYLDPSDKCVFWFQIKVSLRCSVQKS